ncbi:MAG: PQQ-dependent sugar dehydrogenase [Deltaproteobacteria bacterium]|nr:PQQ-dependent sugar dehydrogenase [Deltaproteobacteria bacterium]
MAFSLFAAVVLGSVRAARADVSMVFGHPVVVPAGFAAGVFVSGLGGVRYLAWGPDGSLYASLSSAGEVVRIPVQLGGRQGGAPQVIAKHLDYPFGLAFRGSELWVALESAVVRLEQPKPNAPATGYKVIARLPGGGAHITRTLAFAPDGAHLFVSVGSSCNVCVERDPRRAAVLRFSLDGGGQTVFARGLRNAVGLAIEPATGALWATCNERDNLGGRNQALTDRLPRERVVDIIKQGADYGWPYCYAAADGLLEANPEFGDPGLCVGKAAPVVTDTAHSAPLGAAFYTGRAFPKEYRGNFFVAYHGSWDRTEPSGYAVVRVPVVSGTPRVRAPLPFMTGFVVNGQGWGRPVDVAVGPDGALYVSDDREGAVYRVFYRR